MEEFVQQFRRKVRESRYKRRVLVEKFKEKDEWSSENKSDEGRKASQEYKVVVQKGSQSKLSLKRKYERRRKIKR